MHFLKLMTLKLFTILFLFTASKNVCSYKNVRPVQSILLPCVIPTKHMKSFHMSNANYIAYRIPSDTITLYRNEPKPSSLHRDIMTKISKEKSTSSDTTNTSMATITKIFNTPVLSTISLATSTIPFSQSVYITILYKLKQLRYIYNRFLYRFIATFNKLGLYAYPSSQSTNTQFSLSISATNILLCNYKVNWTAVAENNIHPIIAFVNKRSGGLQGNMEQMKYIKINYLFALFY